jgi:spore coat polysaccharide biosynthesis predicted glycosyltransferase SpsG
MSVNLLKPKIVVVSEVGKQIGLGHLKRSMHLSHYISVFAKVTHFELSSTGVLLIPDLKRNTCLVNSIGSLMEKLNHIKYTVAIVDTLNFYETLHEYFLKIQKPIFYLGKPPKLANGNVYVVNVAEGNQPFNNPANLNLMEGIGYFVPDPKLTEIKKERIISKELKRIMVVFGGTDASYLSKKVFDFALKNKTDFNFHIISHRLNEEVQELILPESNVSISGFLPDIVEKIQNYDFVITSPGNLYFESLYLNVPVVAICQNDRQERDFAYYPLIHKSTDLPEVLATISEKYIASIDFLNNFPEFPGQNLEKLLTVLKSHTVSQ